jgi:ribosomal protein S18 acetylase RimI-like enzyme
VGLAVSRAADAGPTGVRRMVATDVEAVRAVEVDAGARFRSVDDPRIARCADDDPFTASELQAYVDAGRAWVATDAGRIVGFVVVELVDGAAHVEEIAVAPGSGRRGHGAALMGEVDRWAGSEGLRAISLRTFRDVGWNGPWYRRLGFRVLGDAELGPGLRSRREAESARGLPAELRVAMRREVRAGRE